MRFKDKIVLVTGAAGAIGSAAVRRFVEEGATVAVADLDGTRAEALATTFGDRDEAFAVDVADPASAEGMVQAVAARFGRIDVLFNNAGISGKVAPVHELSTEDWQRIVGINLNGMFYVLRATVATMIAGKIKGSVVNMGSSMAGWDVLSGGAGYASTKHGVVGLTRIAASTPLPMAFASTRFAPGSSRPGWACRRGTRQPMKPAFAVSPTAFRCAVSASPRMSPPPSPSWPRTMPATSPASTGCSTADRHCKAGRTRPMRTLSRDLSDAPAAEQLLSTASARYRPRHNALTDQKPGERSGPGPDAHSDPFSQN
ncbi:SDR family NAD(P)-dependent oxidoreductase [Mesorhizobium sp. M2A.F.Ca.ET.039.01.1.1]|uniref:SDR family oxidoreductase n=1 Tax=unclassified Mesorhizobium TaxID=325217 RepID=UPI0026BC88BE